MTPTASDKPEPTPRPWYLTGRYINARTEAGPVEVCRVDMVEDADAAHIVRCVNAHDELVKALEAIIKAWSEPDYGDREQKIDDLFDPIQAARQALALAKGQV